MIWKIGEHMTRFIIKIFLVLMLVNTSVFAKTKTIDLHVTYKTVNFTGCAKTAITVNDQIPAPTLHFKIGDKVIINVHNHLDKDTAIHWHGLILPWQMDGVEGISQTGIAPGATFKYEFTLYQAGTYWYHAHAGLQEQQGLYGAIIIDPAIAPDYKYTQDEVIVLSDWSNTRPENILANLKKEGDYYAPDFLLQPSLLQFTRQYNNSSSADKKLILDDYKMMQQMRMSIYDLSDVAYDAYLLNGQPATRPWSSIVTKNDIVRLRFIGATASTIFRIKIPGTTMQVVQIQGNDVEPYDIQDFTIAPGETYDVLVKIEQEQPYIIYAESNDSLGRAYGALLTNHKQRVNYSSVVKFPPPLPTTRHMMSMNHGMDHGMDHHMNMPMNLTSGTKYQNVSAAVETNDPSKVISKEIKMDLYGYMDRYIWFINGVPEYNTQPIIFEPNKRYRFIFTNSSMMHHPMHLHGHWFILRNGHAEFDPLLHTIDVPPGSTVTADVDTDASGQWFFHCHMLYHMMSGMARVFQYSTLLDITNNKATPQNIMQNTQYTNRPIIKVDELRPINKQLVKHPMAHPQHWYYSSFVDIGINPSSNLQKFTFKGLYGPDYNKLELFINDAEISKGKIENADLDIFYWHLLGEFWALKAGVNYFYRPAVTPYWQPGIGLEGIMPYFIDTDLRAYYYEGSAKFDLEFSRDTQLTNNFFLGLGIRSILASKTVANASLGSGLNQMRYIVRPFYRIKPGLDIFVEYEYERAYGDFNRLQLQAGEATVQNTITLGLACVF